MRMLHFKSDFGSDPEQGFITIIIFIVVMIVFYAISPNDAESVMRGQQGGRAANPNRSRRNQLRRRRRRLEEKYGLGYGSLFYSTKEEMDALEERYKNK